MRGMCGLIGRDDIDTTLTSCKVPVLTATDVLGKRTVVVICNDVDVGHIRIYHVGKAEVNKSVSAGKRYCRNSSVGCKSR